MRNFNAETVSFSSGFPAKSNPEFSIDLRYIFRYCSCDIEINGHSGSDVNEESETGLDLLSISNKIKNGGLEQLKSIIKHKDKNAKTSISIRVEPTTAERLKVVKQRIRALPDVESDIDQRLEEFIVRCVKQAEKELDALQSA